MKKAICVLNDFHYKNGVREDLTLNETYIILEKYSLYDVYDKHGEYINIFGKSTFKIVGNLDAKSEKALNRTKQINEILNDSI